MLVALNRSQKTSALTGFENAIGRKDVDANLKLWALTQLSSLPGEEVTLYLKELVRKSSGEFKSFAQNALSLRIPGATGVYLTEVLKGAEADRAGLKIGDIITHYHGNPVNSINEIWGFQKKWNGKSDIMINVVRHGKKLYFTLTAATLGIKGVSVSKAQ